MKRKYQAVVWDFDGVILDSEEAAWHATNAVRAKHGLQPEVREIYRHRPTNRSWWHIDRGVPLGAGECQKLWREHYDDSLCSLVDGVLELLSHHQTEEIPCAIVSANDHSSINLKLEKFDLHDYFAYVSGGTWDKKERLSAVCRRFSIAPSNALFVGDLLSDLQDGKAAGLTTVLLAPADSPHAPEAHHHITHLEQLVPLLAL